MDVGLSSSDERLDQKDVDKQKKKRDIAKDVKEKFSFLRHHGDPSPGSGKDSKPSRPNAGAVRSWSTSLDALLHDKNGLKLFKEFLASEFSEENLEFWIACEEYKGIEPSKLVAQAQKIYTDFVAIQAPREINLDSQTRELTAAKMVKPDHQTFDMAQKRIQSLMEKDSYPRFLRSDVYHRLAAQFKISLPPT